MELADLELDLQTGADTGEERDHSQVPTCSWPFKQPDPITHAIPGGQSSTSSSPSLNPCML